MKIVRIITDEHKHGGGVDVGDIQGPTDFDLGFDLINHYLTHYLLASSYEIT